MQRIVISWTVRQGPLNTIENKKITESKKADAPPLNAVWYEMMVIHDLVISCYFREIIGSVAFIAYLITKN